MPLRHVLKIINWSAAVVALAIFFIGKDKDYAWIGIVLLAALCIQFLIETVILLRRERYKRRLSDVSEFKENRTFLIKDLESTLSGDALLKGVSIPVMIDGVITGEEGKTAPLSGKKALAYRLVAEAMEGMARVGGQVLLVDSYWGGMSLRDETGTAHVSGPGVLDGSSRIERIFTLENLKEEFPELASRVQDGLGISTGKESQKIRIALREIALFPSDKVRVFGKAELSSGELGISGADILDDPGSLLVRAASSPASSRIPSRTYRIIAFGAVSLCLLGALVVVASTTVIPDMFKTGGIFDATRTGKVSLNLDGRALRITIGTSHWDLRQGDTAKGFVLSSGDSDFQASRTDAVTIQSVTGTDRTIKNGDSDYPRWDGADWLFEAGFPARQSGQAQAGTHSGRLYVRNLTDSSVTLRVLGSHGSPLVDTRWTFNPYEGSDDPKGSYLDVEGAGPLITSGGDRLEITVKKGSYRILPLNDVAKWGQTASWLFQVVPEYLAGEGKLFVKNSGNSPVRIWLLGADGKPLYGEEPWTFEPKEGTSEDKGLRLQYRDEDILITGREAVKLEVQRLTDALKGTLEHVGSWKKGSWTIDMGKIGER
jgi:hypothetical protein